MLPQHVAPAINEIAFRVMLSRILFNKIRVPSVRDEANILTVMLFGIDKTVFFGDLPNGWFGQLPKREKRML